MNIAGIQKLTLVDFPDHVAATVFTRGCSFRCGFCHNPELVIPERFNSLLPEKYFFDFLESRYGKLSGICITGGEPTLQPDIDKFISHIKALGFDVKLDTNGSFPDKLKRIIEDGDLDYIAMDVKAKLSQYESIALSQISNLKSQNYSGLSEAGLSSNVIPRQTENNCHSGLPSRLALAETDDPESSQLVRSIKKSIKLIMKSGVAYEFRTTVCHPLHEVADFEEIGKMIEGAEKYYIQNFVKSKQINEAVEYKPFTDKELREAKKIMKKYVKSAEIR